MESRESMFRKIDSLTEREREVLGLLTKGEKNKDLALQLGISPRTMQKHLQRIYAKLGVEGRTAAALLAIRAATEVRKT